MNPKLKPAYILSLIISVLVLAATAGGLFLGGLYQDNALITMGWLWNDLITLVIALPVLAGALFHSIRGSQRAQLVWLGMLYYTLYNYAFYLFGAALNRFFLIYSALFTLSAFAYCGTCQPPVRRRTPRLWPGRFHPVSNAKSTNHHQGRFVKSPPGGSSSCSTGGLCSAGGITPNSGTG